MRRLDGRRRDGANNRAVWIAVQARFQTGLRRLGDRRQGCGPGQGRKRPDRTCAIGLGGSVGGSAPELIAPATKPAPLPVSQLTGSPDLREFVLVTATPASP